MATTSITTTGSVRASFRYAKDGKDRETGQDKCIAMSGYKIDPNNAHYQIKATAKAYGKENQKVQAYNIVTSFKGQEVSPEKALQVAKEAWQRATKHMNGDFPCAFYVHGNTENIHVHALAQAIDPATGTKLHQKQMWRLIAEKTDQVCLEQGLSIVQDKALERQDRMEYHLNQGKNPKYSWKTDLKERINTAMERTFEQAACSLELFKQKMQEVGVKIHERNHRVLAEPVKFTDNGQTAPTKWETQAIFMYEFEGKDQKKHKAKDYKLGGINYERYEITADIEQRQREIKTQLERNTPDADFDFGKLKAQATAVRSAILTDRAELNHRHAEEQRSALEQNRQREESARQKQRQMAQRESQHQGPSL